MTRLPRLTADRLVKALRKAGFREAHVKGSHALYVHRDDSTRAATVPMHKGKTMKLGTLRAILRQTGLTVEELLQLL